MHARVLAVTLALSSLAACRGDQPTVFPLQWQGIDADPTASSKVAKAFEAHVIQVEPFVDKRAEPARIGATDDGEILFQTATDVGEFCTTHFSAQLRSAGANLVDDDSADVHVRGEILKYEVIEGGMFEGEAQIRIAVATRSGHTWSRTYVGKSKRWGRSHSPENVNEALSNALDGVTQRLLRDDDFAAALAGTSTSSPETSAPGETAPSAPTSSGDYAL